MPSDQILDSTLFVRFNLDDAVTQNLAFSADATARGGLAMRLLLYDRVLIPTTDCGIVPTLIEWLGIEAFMEAVSTGGISFVRREGLIAYVGNGNSISTITISEGESGKTFDWWQHAIFGDLDTALDHQLRNRLALSREERQSIHDAVRPTVQRLVVPNDFFVKNVVEETYRDFRDSPRLSSLLAARYGEPGRIDLARLPGVGPDQVQMLGRQGIRDPVDLILRVADLNLELLACATFGGADLLTAEGTQDLLVQKVARARSGQHAVDGFMRLVTLRDLPDVGAAVAAGAFILKDVWRLRRTAASTQFRKWLQTVAATDGDAIVRAYMGVLHSEPRAERLPLKMIRLAITAAIHAHGEVSGVAAGAVDTFVVDRFLNGYSPRVFLDQLEHLDLPS
jgi:hypothetical protein